jgi:cation diffusion facilitator family transporter
MISFLIKRFVKDCDNIDSAEVRAAYGRLAGTVGIGTNAFLGALKVLLGYLSGSIAILADAVNNLSDMAASLATLIGFKMASKESDKDHPYGHARIEYMTGIVVSALIILVGFQLLSSSYDKILAPEVVTFNVFTVIVLVAAIGLKVWQSIFYFSLGKRIKSAALKATGVDSRNDVIATSAVLVGLIIGEMAKVDADGYIGVAVACFILYSGIKLIRETSRPLLGQAPDPDLVEKIKTLILSQDGVLGVHDLVVHDYGPGKLFASVHIEVDAAKDVLKSHDVIDTIEREAMKKWKIELVGHMDPVDINDPLVNELKEKMTQALVSVKGAVSLHDLRIVRREQGANVIFDVVLSAEACSRAEEIRGILQKELKKTNEALEAVITFDTDFTATE